MEINSIGMYYLSKDPIISPKIAFRYHHSREFESQTDLQFSEDIVRAACAFGSFLKENKPILAFLPHQNPNFLAFDISSVFIGAQSIHLDANLNLSEWSSIIEKQKCEFIFFQNWEELIVILSKIQNLRTIKYLISSEKPNEDQEKKIRNLYQWFTPEMLLSKGEKYLEIHPDYFERMIKSTKNSDLISFHYFIDNKQTEIQIKEIREIKQIAFSAQNIFQAVLNLKKLHHNYINHFQNITLAYPLNSQIVRLYTLLQLMTDFEIDYYLISSNEKIDPRLFTLNPLLITNQENIERIYDYFQNFIELKMLESKIPYFNNIRSYIQNESFSDAENGKLHPFENFFIKRIFPKVLKLFIKQTDLRIKMVLYIGNQEYHRGIEKICSILNLPFLKSLTSPYHLGPITITPPTFESPAQNNWGIPIGDVHFNFIQNRDVHVSTSAQGYLQTSSNNHHIDSSAMHLRGYFNENGFFEYLDQ